MLMNQCVTPSPLATSHALPVTLPVGAHSGAEDSMV